VKIRQSPSRRRACPAERRVPTCALAGDHAGLDEINRAALSGSAARVAKLNEQIADPLLDPSKRLQLEVERNQLDREAQALRRSLAERLPRFRALSEVRLVDAEQATRLLTPRTAAVSYMVAEDRLFAFILVPGRPVAVHDLMPVDALRDLVEAFVCSPWARRMSTGSGSAKMEVSSWRRVRQSPQRCESRTGVSSQPRSVRACCARACSASRSSTSCPTARSPKFHSMR
jgi:hypothetical protein